MNRSPRTSPKPHHLIRVPLTAVTPKGLSADTCRNLRVYVGAIAGSLAKPRVRHTQVGRVIEIEAESILIDVGGLSQLHGPLAFVQHSQRGPHLIAAGVV